MQLLDETVQTEVTTRLAKLEAHLNGDVGFYYGPIDTGVLRTFRDFIEKLAAGTTCDCKRLIKEWVPALGYLDKVEQLLAKAAGGQLTNAEFLILQNQDLALLSRYEQARDLTVTLLKKWLVEYKFRDWTTHGSDPGKKGQPVTTEEKQARAEEIARILGDNKQWHSHGRMIGPATLSSVLRLRINDYSGDADLRSLIRSYDDLLTQYIVREGFNMFLHSRDYF